MNFCAMSGALGPGCWRAATCQSAMNRGGGFPAIIKPGPPRVLWVC